MSAAWSPTPTAEGKTRSAKDKKRRDDNESRTRSKSSEKKPRKADIRTTTAATHPQDTNANCYKDLLTSNRVIATILCYDLESKRYKPTKDIRLSDCRWEEVPNGHITIRCWTYRLQYGGVLKFYPNFVPLNKCQSLIQTVLENYQEIVRQYNMQNGKGKNRNRYWKGSMGKRRAWKQIS